MEDAEAHTTAILLERIRAGDHAAKVALVDRIGPLLLRFARGRVPTHLRHRQETADLVQLTWLKVLRHLEQIEIQAPGDFYAYLRTVLLNTLRQALRDSRVEPDDTPASAPPSVLPAEETDPTDWLAWEQALARLEPEYRNLVLMRFEFGMTFVEIAGELGQTADGVRMKINRALVRMAEAADDHA